MHFYIGLRVHSTPYLIWPGLTVPSVTGTIARVDGHEVTLLLDDGSHTTRSLTQIVLDDPAEGIRRLTGEKP